jgi:hypothetical protein
MVINFVTCATQYDVQDKKYKYHYKIGDVRCTDTLHLHIYKYGPGMGYTTHCFFPTGALF